MIRGCLILKLFPTCQNYWNKEISVCVIFCVVVVCMFWLKDLLISFFLHGRGHPWLSVPLCFFLVLLEDFQIYHYWDCFQARSEDTFSYSRFFYFIVGVYLCDHFFWASVQTFFCCWLCVCVFAPLCCWLCWA